MVSNPLTDPAWADRIVDVIDRMVSTIRRYTTQPLVTGARGIVFGLLASFGIITMIVLLLLGLTRGVQEALDAFLPRDGAVWSSYFVLAALFTLIGAVLMRKRYTDEETE
ncbi:MAG: hypothetical protein ACKOCC_02370 [Actinomycetota bacterium]